MRRKVTNTRSPALVLNCIRALGYDQEWKTYARTLFSRKTSKKANNDGPSRAGEKGERHCNNLRKGASELGNKAKDMGLEPFSPEIFASQAKGESSTLADVSSLVSEWHLRR
jgi:hypothetical protein